MITTNTFVGSRKTVVFQLAEILLRTKKEITVSELLLLPTVKTNDDVREVASYLIEHLGAKVETRKVEPSSIMVWDAVITLPR